MSNDIRGKILNNKAESISRKHASYNVLKNSLGSKQGHDLGFAKGCLDDGRLLLEHQTRQTRCKSVTPVTKKKVLTKTFQFFYEIKP